MNHPEADFGAVFFDVIPKYSLSPKPLYVFHLKENEPHKEKIKIINNYKEDLEIESTTSKNNTVKMIDFNKVQDDYEMNIEITPPPITDGKRRFTDIFYINLKGGEQLALNCTGYYD